MGNRPGLDGALASLRVRCARTLVASLLLLAAGMSLAQSNSRTARIEMVVSDDETRARPIVQAFRTGMRELSQIEGESYVLSVQYAQGRVDNIPQLVASGLARRPDLFIAGNFVAVRAAKEATQTIPIAAFSCGLEVLVESLPRPGKNLTGVTCQSAELAAKQLEMLREALPSTTRLAVLTDVQSPYAESTLRELRNAAGHFGLQLIEIGVRDPSGFEAAAIQIRRSGAQAVFIAPDTMFFGSRHALMRRLLAERLPVMGFFREFAEAGALMSYSADRTERYHRLAWYADRILKGARPGDLPVDQPTRFQLVINLKTANDLGVAIPRSLLLRADDVIE